jgi:predicted XRE-type DNA-binding protein
VPEPEEELAKAQLASRIREIIRSSRFTQVAAAAMMGIDQPKVSALLNGRLSSFSSERLMRLLTRLGQDVEIVVKSKPRRRRRGRIRSSRRLCCNPWSRLDERGIPDIVRTLAKHSAVSHCLPADDARNRTSPLSPHARFANGARWSREKNHRMYRTSGVCARRHWRRPALSVTRKAAVRRRSHSTACEPLCA